MSVTESTEKHDMIKRQAAQRMGIPPGLTKQASKQSTKIEIMADIRSDNLKYAAELAKGLPTQ